MTTTAITADTMSFMPTEDGGAVLRLDDLRIALTIDQTNALLRGLLNIATIKIEPDAVAGR